MNDNKYILSIDKMEIEVEKATFEKFMLDFDMEYITYDDEYSIKISKCNIKSECKYKYKMVKEMFISETNNLFILEIRGY